jgi:hypothetical protein
MCWVYNARQIPSHRIGSSEFIEHSLLHLYNSQLQLLPSAVSQLLLLLPFTPANAGLQLTGYSLSLVTGSMLTTHRTVFAAPYLGSARTT